MDIPLASTVRIPKSPDFDKNNRKACGDFYPCVVCGREVKKRKYFVECVHGGVDECALPGTADANDPGYMGCYPIGSDCLKRWAFLKPYVTKVEGE